MAAAGVTDLFVFSHGWGTSQDSARQLYNTMFPLIRTAAHGLAGIGTVGFAGIYWPSLWFPPTPATPPPAAGAQQADAGAVVDLSAGTAALSGADIAAALQPGFADPAQAATPSRRSASSSTTARARPGRPSPTTRSSSDSSRSAS